MKLQNLLLKIMIVLGIITLIFLASCSSVVTQEYHIGDCVETDIGRAVIVSGIIPDSYAGDWAMITYGGQDEKGGITAGGCLLKDMKKISCKSVPDSVKKKAEFWIKNIYPDMLKKGLF